MRATAILIGSGLASGALVGLVLAIVAAPIATTFTPSTGQIAALVAVGAALDAVQLALGRPGPPTLGRQVPQEWARWFAAPVTALLYGARLGVGPLTILSTWTWWSVTVAASLLGPGSGALTGATFGLVKLTAVAITSGLAEPAGHSRLFGWLRAGRRPSWGALTAVTLALSALATSCGAATAGPDLATPTPEPDPTADAIQSRATETTSTAIAADAADTDLIIPAELEDVVRTSAPDHTDPTVTEQPSPEQAAAQPVTLGDELLEGIADYESIDDPTADRHLDLLAAADIQPDPTEEIALLETRGYRGGWLRAFRNRHNDVAVATVYQFRDPGEAEFYLEDGLITIGGYGGTFFDIPDLPGVRGFVQQLSESDGESTEELVSLGASFHRDDRWYLLYFIGSPDRVTPEVLVPALAEQVARVGGPSS